MGNKHEDERMKRRDVLRFLGTGAALAAGYGVASWLDGVVPLGRPGRMLSETRLGMGTYVSLSVVDPSQSRAEEALGAAWAVLDRLEARLTRFRPESALSALNSHGRLDGAPEDLTRVLDLAVFAHRATKGAFDPTVLPVLAYIEESAEAGRRPDPSRLEELRGLVGLERVRWDGRSVHLDRAGMALTLDGVAKGYIVDRMAEALRERGVRHGLVDAGGDIAAFGGKAEGLPWMVAVRNPADVESPLARLELTDGACATSGDYEVYFDKERLFHHIVDPAMGVSPHLIHSSTVLADTAARADSLATALLVLGPWGEDVIRPHVSRVILA